MSQQESMLVVSAHAADFVWRAGGAVALAASRGDRVTVLCLSYGERGESASAWRAGKTLEEIKAQRRGEAESAAAALGAAIEFLDAGDYPLRESDELTDRIVQVYREVNPSVVLTHTLADPYNGDHPVAPRRGQRDRAARPPDEIGRVRADHQHRSGAAHRISSSVRCSSVCRRASITLRRWLLAACSASAGRPAATAAMIARCSGSDACGRPGRSDSRN